MSVDRPRWYLDACVITRLLENHPDAPAIRDVMQLAEAGLATIVVNTIMLIEVTRERHRPIDPAKTAMILRFFERSCVYMEDFHQPLARQSFDLIYDYLWLKPHDAAHLATAIARQCQVFYTYDSELLDKFNGEHGLQVIRPGDRIRAVDDLVLPGPLFSGHGDNEEPV